VPTEQENRAIFRRYLEEVGNQGNLELAGEIVDRYISHQPDTTTLERGPEYVKRIRAAQYEAFPNMRVSIEDQIAEGDKLASRLTLRGTHLREFQGIAPTGEEVELRGISIFRFSEDVASPALLRPPAPHATSTCIPSRSE